MVREPPRNTTTALDERQSTVPAVSPWQRRKENCTGHSLRRQSLGNGLDLVLRAASCQVFKEVIQIGHPTRPCGSLLDATHPDSQLPLRVSSTCFPPNLPRVETPEGTPSPHHKPRRSPRPSNYVGKRIINTLGGKSLLAKLVCHPHLETTLGRSSPWYPAGVFPAVTALCFNAW